MTSLHDVDDVYVFARKMVGVVRHHIAEHALTPDQWDEMQDEMVTILYELAARYDHHRPGYKQPGSFAGYAAKYAPKRALDRMGAICHSWISCAELEYPPGAAQTRTHDGFDQDEFLGEEKLLGEMSPWDRASARRVLLLLEEGCGHDEIARRLGMRRGDVGRVCRAIYAALTRGQPTAPLSG